MSCLEYEDRQALYMALATQLADDLRHALDSASRATFVVPGGTTPGPIFDLLCEADLDWSRVDVMLSDERWLPEDDARSNTGLLRQRLLIKRAAVAGYLPLYVPYARPEEGLAELSSAVEAHLPIAVLLLGMGADMHTASLFPGADRLTEALAPEAPVLLAMRAAGAPEARITLSARTLDAAAQKHIVITGVEKRQALDAAYDLPAATAPVRAVLEGTTVHWAP